jgi:3-methyladenine DNA glycosylase/8-oxoguanine DNA glycosylase
MGRVDLDDPAHEAGWARLRRIPGIGQWTIDMLAQQGQGRHDVVPAGDLGFLKLIGRRLTGGDPYARATEEQVREAFAPYGPWAGPAAAHALRAGAVKSAARPIEAAAA